MKFLNVLLLSSFLALTLSACLKDKSAEQAAPEQTMEQPAEAVPTETPADTGTTQTN